MAENWSNYEHLCADVLAERYESYYDNVSVLPQGEHNSHVADAAIQVNEETVISVEFKSVQKAGDKCVMAPFTITEDNGVLVLTDSAKQRVDKIMGMTEIAEEIKFRSEEIIPLEGKTAYVREWTQYDDGDDFECEYTDDNNNMDFQEAIARMIADYYKEEKGVSYYMIGANPFPFSNNWEDILDFFDFYIQVRAKPSGGAKIRPFIIDELEYLILNAGVSEDQWYIDAGRVYIDSEVELDGIFPNWVSHNVFKLTDPQTNEICKLNCTDKGDWIQIKPHPTNLTVMPYGVYNGNIANQDEAWNDLDFKVDSYSQGV